MTIFCINVDESQKKVFDLDLIVCHMRRKTQNVIVDIWTNKHSTNKMKVEKKTKWLNCVLVVAAWKKKRVYV
jgi:hypothetical protein